MREIAADTAPLNYLVLIKAVRILRQLFASVLIPPAVKEELSNRNAPAVVRAGITNPPSWLNVVTLKLPPDPALHTWMMANAKQYRLSWNSR
jgi:predicted nucleic acid-binding protein